MSILLHEFRENEFDTETLSGKSNENQIASFKLLVGGSLSNIKT